MVVGTILSSLGRQIDVQEDISFSEKTSSNKPKKNNKPSAIHYLLQITLFTQT